MQKKVRSVRVPVELGSIDLSGIMKECEQYLRDLESATLLKSQGNKEAAEALIRTRETELGKRIGRLVYEARVRYGGEKRRIEDDISPA
ncbi:hypothetical protein [Desulfovibrio inopinatus]|uniref:hypothetical protein n=1 Tax=Desulfovibrio inopinatus TaxID=102109 RepID=UPI00048152BD|nr:hypothetical protein [Desulfovibrio inopinatus]